jgi:hypothetical protein
MLKCAACSQIVTSKRGVEGHTALQRSDTRKVKPFAQAVIWLEFYKCSKCGTLWRHEDDKNDQFAGWTEVEP